MKGGTYASDHVSGGGIDRMGIPEPDRHCMIHDTLDRANTSSKLTFVSNEPRSNWI